MIIGKGSIILTRILFICHGNICRSPMAEFIFKYLCKGEYEVTSMATSTEELGNDMYPPAKRVLKANGIPFEPRRAKQVTKKDMDYFDHILCMDEYNLRNLNRMFGPNKAKLLTETPIDDPWYTGDFDGVYRQIYDGCFKLLEQLKGE